MRCEDTLEAVLRQRLLTASFGASPLRRAELFFNEHASHLLPHVAAAMEIEESSWGRGLPDRDRAIRCGSIWTLSQATLLSFAPGERARSCAPLAAASDLAGCLGPSAGFPELGEEPSSFIQAALRSLAGPPDKCAVELELSLANPASLQGRMALLSELEIADDGLIDWADGARERAAESGQFASLRWYPVHSNGFQYVGGATLRECLAAAGLGPAMDAFAERAALLASVARAPAPPRSAPL